MSVLEFRVLGPLEVLADGRVLDPLPAKARALLALLLLHPREVVAADTLIDGIWGERAPATAPKLLQGYVSGLRTWLPGTPHQTVVTRPRGYLARVDPDQLDLARAEHLIAQGRAALQSGRPEAAVASLRSALALWRGAPLADLQDAAFAPAAIEHLEELRLGAHESCLESELQLGRHPDAVQELREMVAANPFRERLSGLLMLALYRSGRQADALEVYRDTRGRLAGELGLEPGDELRRLEGEILAQAPGLRVSVPARVALPSPSSARRVVTVLRVGLADPGVLARRVDPEVLHGRLNRCWDRCAAIVERHGGAVQGVRADALDGVFGLGQVHEDDAHRAVRAALELCEAGGLPLRVGVDTGLVYVGAGARGAHFATGEPITGATRLQAAAAAGEVLIGARTHELVGGRMRSSPVANGWRLLRESEPEPRAPATVFFGRETELAALRAVLADVVRSGVCRVVTILGPPGIGKSRLIDELTRSISEPATVLVGRCVAYGEGVTFRPLADVVRQLGTARVQSLLDEPARGRVLGAVGDVPPPGRLEETFWAFRRLFEALAHDRPLVLVTEDAQWAEPAMLELLESIAAFSVGTPMLLLCAARPELLERSPGWSAPLPGRSLVLLDRLSDAHARELAVGLGAGAAAQRLAVAAGGNPFFLEQLAAVQREHGKTPTLPPSVQAVLAARIHGLSNLERTLLERASIEGHRFHRMVLAELTPESEREGVEAGLLALVRRQMILPERPEFPGQDAFCFAHALIREAAYDEVPKRVRAQWHERVARCLALLPGAADATVGYQLEQAYRQGVDLGMPGPAELAVAGEASRRLERAARTSLLSGDLAGGAQLLERAVALLAPGDPACADLLPSLAVAHFESGNLAAAERALAMAERSDDRRLAARAAVEREFLRLHVETTPETGAAREVAITSARTLRSCGDELGQCRASRLLAWVEWIESQAARADTAWQRAAEHAERAGADRELFEILGWRASAAAFGPLPVGDAIRRCNAIRERVAASHVATAVVVRPLALLYALRGEVATARALIAEANAILEDLGRLQSSVSHHEAVVELIAGEPAVAERRLREGYERLADMGEKALLATTAAYLAQAVLAQGRSQEADELCTDSERSAPPDDLVTHVIWRGVRARIRAGEGRLDEAEELARAAVEIAARTDALVEHGDALVALADVLARRQRPGDTETALRAALGLYERKGATILARRTRTRLQTTTGRR